MGSQVPVALLLVFLILFCLEACKNGDAKLRPIRVGLAIDDHSLKDLVILINSVIESAMEPNDLVFHIVACGKDKMAAMVLKNSIATSLANCLPDVRHELVPFTLPAGSGFAQQLEQLKKKSNHWNSQSGADMVRFFMPSIFSHVPRILYLDNDIIVSCCLEEVWDTSFETHQIVGIALDDLNWATVTQFKRHYNASHPLVVKNMRRNQKAGEVREGQSATEISTKEFSAALPRYPNDGVLLIDVDKYNRAGILTTMEEIAAANAKGEYCVNLGTQQFTVLALYDRWKELTPRANLRHFPDMARGYLMWFYYNGFLHYAGQHKPRQLCLSTTAENAQGRVPYLRVMSYAAWALSNHQVQRRCPADRLAYVAECVPHVKEAPTLPALLQVLGRIISASPDPSLVYVHVGPLHGDVSLAAYQKSIAGSGSAGGSGVLSNVDSVQTLLNAVLHNSSWSVRVFDFKLSRVEQSTLLLNKVGIAATTTTATPAEAGKKGNKGKKGPPPRTVVVKLKHLCESDRSPYRAGENSTCAEHSASDPKSGQPCDSMLQEIKSEGRAHWDVQMIVLDAAPPQSFAPVHGSPAGAKIGLESDSGYVKVSKHSSLGVLLSLDLVFMRPKIVFLRLAASSASKLQQDATVAHRFLRQNGYLTAQSADAECGDSRTARVHHSTASTAEQTEAVTVVVQFMCVWGLRVNEFEFFPNLLT